MKKMLVAIGLILTTQAFACPDLSGSYIDKNGESVVLAQTGCEQVSILSRPLSHTLILDNQFTVVQDDADVTAEGRGIFQADELILEVKVVYKKNPGIPTIFLPVRAVNRYTLTPVGDLFEKSTIYNVKNGVLANTKTTYKKVN
jgi:hypothetical protein